MKLNVNAEVITLWDLDFIPKKLEFFSFIEYNLNLFSR